MTDLIATPTSTSATDPVTRRRIRVVAVVLGLTAVAAVPAGVLWPEATGGGQAYAYGDIAPVRDLWWGLLLGLGALQSLNVPAQAIATMVLVRRRGSALAGWGAGLMCLGASLQGVGITMLAGAYFFATDPSVPRTDSAAVFDAIAHDQLHLLAALISGALLVLLGTVVLVVGLFRSHAVPVWVPAAMLFIVATFVVPGAGALGLVTSLPMTIGHLGLAYYAWRAVSAPDAHSGR